MKLGLCYMVFDGEELLEFSLKSVRSQVDHLSVTYQTTSYWGNKADTDIAGVVQQLQKVGLIDEAIFYEPNLNESPKENEMRLRNVGLAASKKAGCTHHISADVDELYDDQQLAFAKSDMESGGYDMSVAHYENYYKEPTYLVVPPQDMYVSCIHSIDNEYNMHLRQPDFPFPIEITRRLVNHDKIRIFKRDELLIHHMMNVRKNIQKKYANSSNKILFNLEKFMKQWDNHKVGDRVCLLPDYINRRTVLVPNRFGIVF